MSRLCEATFCYENMSVLIRKNYFKKWGSLKFIQLLRVVFSSQQRLNRRAVNAFRDVTHYPKPGSDFDWLIV